MRVVSSGITGFAVLRRGANEDGFFRPIVREVVEKYLDCGNPRSGFALIRKAHVGQTKRRPHPVSRLRRGTARHVLLPTRGFCPSCHAKRVEEWGEWMREMLLLDVPHRQIVFTAAEAPGSPGVLKAAVLARGFRPRASGKPKARPLTIPKRLRVFFKFDRRLLDDLCRSALRSLSCYFERDGTGQETEVMDYLEFIARVTSHIPDKGQVMVRYYGLYANAHRGKVKKASLSPSALRIVEEELRRLPSKP